MLSSIVLASLSNARDQAEDAKLLLQLRDLNTAVTSYNIDKGHYPAAEYDPYGSNQTPTNDPIDRFGILLLQQLKDRGYSSSNDISPYSIYKYIHICDNLNPCVAPLGYINDLAPCGASPTAVAGLVFKTRKSITQYPQWFILPQYYIMCFY
jgi:type II secretory pathway pseudopilin PulG